MQIRSFRGSGEPARVIASSNARDGLGPDPRRALGPAAIRAASTGRTRDRTRPMLQKRQKVLARATLGLSSAVTRGTAACSEPNVQFGGDATVVASSRETKLNRADHNTRFLFGACESPKRVGEPNAAPSALRPR